MAGILAAALGGCGRPKLARTPPPLKIAVEAEAAPSINRDANGDPLSVVVRIYHLKDKGEFSRLTFDQAASGRSDQELLGPDLLGRSEFVVVPGTSFLRSTELAPGTTYLGVVALFRKPDPHYWRYLVNRGHLKAARPARMSRKEKKVPILSFKVQDCCLALNGCRLEPIPGQPLDAKPECSGDAFSPPYRPARPSAP